MTTLPTILWVHGAWHTPVHFQPVIEVFKQAGYESVCPRLPSMGNLPPIGMMDDAQCIRDELIRLVEREGKDVVVIAHSYGGSVANQGVEDHFARAQRAKDGKPGGVLRVIFLAAVMVNAGECLSAPWGGGIAPIIDVDDQKMSIMMNIPHMFYNDMPPAEQDKWAAECVKCPASDQTDPITHVLYPSHPVSYIHCTLDNGVTYDAQQWLVKSISERYGVEISTQTLEASHSAYLSVPDQVLAAVQTLVASDSAALRTGEGYTREYGAKPISCKV